MKKNLLLLAAIICTFTIHAQDTKKLFGSSLLVYYGMDFSNSKMIGFGDESPHKIRDEYFKAWNSITIDMDLTKTFQKNAVAKDMVGITKINLARETETLKSTEEKAWTKEEIAEMVKNVPVGTKKEGVAVVMMVQSFNKTAELATVHVVFFDIASHNILWLKKMTAKPSGGAANKAWAAAMKDIFTQIEKKEFTAWKKEANY